MYIMYIHLSMPPNQPDPAGSRVGNVYNVRNYGQGLVTRAGRGADGQGLNRMILPVNVVNVVLMVNIFLCLSLLSLFFLFVFCVLLYFVSYFFCVFVLCFCCCLPFFLCCLFFIFFVCIEV